MNKLNSIITKPMNNSCKLSMIKQASKLIALVTW